MSQANLSETLFKPRFKHPETSTLVRRFSAGKPQAMQSALSGNHVDHWYREPYWRVNWAFVMLIPYASPATTMITSAS